MAARPNLKLEKALKCTKVVAAGQSVSRGRCVKRVTDDDQCQHSGAGEDGLGFALNDAAAGERVTVVMLGSGGEMTVKVGTGGATAGSFGVNVADGVTNVAALDGGSAAAINIVCKFTQTGVAGDEVGALLINAPAVT